MKPTMQRLCVLSAAILLYGCAPNSLPPVGGSGPQAVVADGAAVATPSMTATYLGEKSVSSIIPDAVPGNISNDKILRVWYNPARRIYLAVDPAANWSDADVAALWRALDRIEQRFPDLYATVFTGSKDGRTRALPYPSNDPWTNTNIANAFIVVDKEFGTRGKPAMAANYYFVGRASGSVYPNVPFIGLDPEVIAGRVPGYGPQVIYASRTPEQARAAYFEEGLADTILHERLHGFISQFFGHDRLYGTLRPQGPQPACESDLEELLVKKFLMEAYAKPNAGFSQEFMRYWTRDTSILEANVVTSECYRRLTQGGLLSLPLVQMP